MNIAVVGAGAAGLFLSRLLSETKNCNIHIYERTGKPGYKVKASGGGKANILNTHISGECYNNAAFIANLLSRVNYQTIRDEFEKMGLKMSVDEENRVYPSTFFSQTVLDVLLNDLSDRVQFHYNTEVQQISSKGRHYYINEEATAFDTVVLASGSPAGMIAKNRKHFDRYLTDFKLQRKDFQASLVGFKLEDYPIFLSGCRCKAICSLYQKGKLIYQENGEVTFKDDGVSGIVILNLSAYYNRLKDKRNCSIGFNFMYDDPDYDVDEHLRKHHNLCGLLHPKLNRLYERKQCNIKDLRFKIKDTYELEFAQVCTGGIAVEEINDDFELKKYPNIYAIGEMIDIDGICGGYNLFFAWASAYLCAQSIIHSCVPSARGVLP
ncbi:MAG: NAD(P)/FAD-dependent oxidoreductase [Bacteroidales bacterium]|nr:NAD(P)/FAD-dependent oxidoreductase [Bacteroidales bacterium]